jgi:hypothetical protein
MYSGIVRNHLYWYEAVHTSLYLLVMRFTILAKSTFRFGTEYIQICTAIWAEDHEQHYKEVCTATEQRKVVWYYSIVQTNAALCHTKYAPSLYSKVDRNAGLQRHCNVEVWEFLGPNPVPSTY